MEKIELLIESFDQACELRGYDPATCLPNVEGCPPSLQKSMVSFAMLLIICEAQNEGHQFDWNNDEEYKWFPWFDMEKTASNPSGFRFGVSVYYFADTSLAGGSRLALRTKAVRSYRENIHSSFPRHHGN
jgi:hypothetical protein